MADTKIDSTLWETLTAMAVDQIDADLRWKQPRMDDIKKNEDLYANKKEPALPGQWSIPLPMLGGFVDSLISELNQPVKVNFDKTELGDLKKAQFANGLWTYDSAPNRAAWKIKDLRAKKLAALSGRAIFNIFAESDPVYQSHLRNVHHYNFYCEQKAGAIIEDMQHLGEINCFKTEYDLTKGPMAASYDQEKVSALLATQPSEDDQKKYNDTFANIRNSFQAMGLNPDMPIAAGNKIYNFAQHYMDYEGVRYYLLIEPMRKTAIRIVPLKEIFKRGKWPYKSWATHDDPGNFWSKAPSDDVRPIAISMKEVFDSAFNELTQRLRGKRAVDPNYFPNRAELEDFTTRFVEAKVPSGKTLRDGFVEFTTPDNTTVVVNIMRFLDSFLGQKTGVTPGAQGQAVEDKVGIYYGNIQQVARRMNLYSDFYKQCYAELGEAWLDGAQEHCKGKISIKILGAMGYESAEISRQDLQFETDPDINITGGTDEDVINAKQNEQKALAIANAIKVPALFAQYNPKWLAEQNLLVGGFDASDVKRALDLDTYGDQEVISAAYEAITLILEGETPPPNRSANQAFLQTLLDYTQDYPELTEQEYKAIMDYFNKHIEIALQNAVRKAQFIQRQKMMAAPEMGAPAQPGAPALPPGTPSAPAAPVQPPQLSTGLPQG